jgi:hypothetical protein
MFEVGKVYTIKMWSDNDGHGILTDHHHCKVLEVAPPVIKIKRSLADPVIVNTASIAFVQATEERTQDE